MEQATKDKLKVAGSVAAVGGGIYVAANANDIAARVERGINEAHKRKVGGTPDDIGGSMEDKLERLARRAKGTPEGEAAARKLNALKGRKTSAKVGSVIKKGKDIIANAVSKFKPRKVAVGHLLSARDELNELIEFSFIGDVNDLRRSNHARMTVGGVIPEGESSMLNRLRMKLAQKKSAAVVAKNQPGLIPNKMIVPLSARDELDSIMEFSRGDQTAAAIGRLTNRGHLPFDKGIEAVWDVASNPPKRGSLGASALANQVKILKKKHKFMGGHMGQPAKLLSARDAIDSIIELKATDLGYTQPTLGAPDGNVAEQAGPNKKHYPCLYINDCDTEIDLPAEGEAIVRYKLRSRTIRHDDLGKKRHSADIEIQSIDPVDDEERGEGESNEGLPAQPLEVDMAARGALEDILQLSISDEIHDSRLYSNLRGALESKDKRVAAHQKLSRPYKKDSVLEAAKSGLRRMSDPSGEIRFGGERVGEGIADALRKIMQKNKSAGAGLVVKRTLSKPRPSLTIHHTPKEAWRGDYFHVTSLSARDALSEIIELGDVDYSKRADGKPNGLDKNGNWADPHVKALSPKEFAEIRRRLNHGKDWGSDVQDLGSVDDEAKYWKWNKKQRRAVEAADSYGMASRTSAINFERGDMLYRKAPNFPPPTSGRVPLRGGLVQSEAASVLKKIRKGAVKLPDFLTHGLSARDQLEVIMFDPRPRNDLGMFTDQEGGPNPNEIDAVYKQPTRTIGQNLAGGAVAGVGAAASGSALKALIEKFKKSRV